MGGNIRFRYVPPKTLLGLHLDLNYYLIILLEISHGDDGFCVCVCVCVVFFNVGYFSVFVCSWYDMIVGLFSISIFH